MALYTIGDVHLSIDKPKSMAVFGGWDNYVQRLEANWLQLITPEDTVVIPGDVSWGMNLEEAKADFAFLHALPGQKLLLKGNHDYWWTTRRRMDTFLAENDFHTLRIVHNDAVAVEERWAICGSRGWFYDAEEDADKKVLLREAGRLRTSIRAAKETGLQPVVFLHYPPVYADQRCPEIMDVLLEEGVSDCYYGHIHSTGIRLAVQEEREGIAFHLVSADALRFCPHRIG
ncbi:MAG: metallophosphoesterase [Clostridia bacterium]|nr:metallophosphoesterase [Clostridia bacterium]